MVAGITSELIKAVSQFAPLIGEVLPIPGGAIIGELIAHLFNGSVENPTDLISKINADPDAKLKLEQLELQHKDTLQKLKSQNYVTSVQDRESARELDEEYLTKTGKGNPMLPFLVVMLFAGISSLLYAIIFCTLPTGTLPILVMILTTLVHCLKDVYEEYFGGDDSSPDKS